ncbi:hypothetical protein DAPPUDRAFT_222355 [Daphnia pulex]|uniref:Uncharacterized protein n=1 Tax=Daphnia pulex TaxID=6669 RepID=E9G3F6_DAPPU|nr:hypothetical protein DAPPUDRAFT_222355 [Daphnia pulex]|eukprot:EFX85765.1 hypothetical protein DAPPUDRAFT_222355 [Daphnia pulex]
MDEKPGDWDWEDGISRGFQQMVQIQDKETGECWTVAKETDCMGACGESKAMCSRIKQSVSGWKIPKEYSLLGSTSSFKAEGVQPVFTTVDSDVQMNSSWTCENDDSSDQTAIIATFPSPGKLPAFCRKRRCSVSAAAAKIDSSAKPTKNPVGNSAIERFLEGRERLLFVGRLLFAFLVLLSPGYFFPLLFFIRTYCHFWKHNASVDQEEEVFERTHSGPFSFFHAKAFLKYSCRLCREKIKTEKMFRIHSKIGSSSSFHKNAAFSEPEVQDYSDDCPHNHFY